MDSSMMRSSPSEMFFLYRDDLDTTLLQNPFIVSAVIAVTGESAELPDQHHIEQLALAVLYHILKFQPSAILTNKTLSM